jgi:replicative DNA helicase
MICNIEAEQKILGAILFEPDSMLETSVCWRRWISSL